jgi:hypothetical protein
VSVRTFFESSAGKAAAVGICLFGLALAVVFVSRSVGDPTARNSTDRVFVDAENGKTFYYTLKVGDRVPVKSPYSGKNTGFEPERCFWTADGKVKAEPTYVLLNDVLGKDGPTFCPDCKRLVVGQNPVASAGGTPPPTEAEYQQRRAARANRGGQAGQTSQPANN